jgi:hypothetical protein
MAVESRILKTPAPQLALQRASYARHRGARLAEKKIYYRDHKEELRPRLLATAKRWRDKLREKMFVIYGDVCARCGFEDKRALQLDHIHGQGYRERKKLGPRVISEAVKHPNKTKYQILCANCNQIKRHENKEFRTFQQEVS